MSALASWRNWVERRRRTIRVGQLARRTRKMPITAPSNPLEIANSLLLDHAAIEILSALSAANIPALLLKGASFHALYPDQPRVYFDIDIMVPQTEWALATQALERLRFERRRVSKT